jgi:hypothetical protein
MAGDHTGLPLDAADHGPGCVGRGAIVVQIAAAHPRGLDLEDHVSGAWGRIGELSQLQLSISEKHDAFHGFLRCTILPSRHDLRRIAMTVYEMRTYTLHVGKMGEAVKLYTEFGYPALQKGGQDKKLIGYFQADTGTINQLVHLWKFDDDADRRAHWASVFANKDFVEGFAVKFRPLVASQEVKLLTAAPWGPHP